MRSMPIPCVDIMVERSGEVLLGFRAIAPYKNVDEATSTPFSAFSR
jgi:hypothetical protein